MLLRTLLITICAASFARAQADQVAFIPTELEQRADGYILLSCSFGMHGRHVKYVVVTGMNKVSEGYRAVGSPDSAAVQVFAGGKWRAVPNESFCGTGGGISHFVPQIYQTMLFGIGMHEKLRHFVAQFGDPEAGVLVRAEFSADIVRPDTKTVESVLVRSNVCFARIGATALQGTLLTFYRPDSEEEAQALLDRIRNEPNLNQHPVQRTGAGARR